MLADQKGRRFEQRAFDRPAPAGAMTPLQRRKDRDRAEHAPGDVDHRTARAQRPSRRAGHIGEAAHHLGDFVERGARSEEHTSELPSIMRISYAVLCLKKNKTLQTNALMTYTIQIQN